MSVESKKRARKPTRQGGCGIRSEWDSANGRGGAGLKKRRPPGDCKTLLQDQLCRGAYHRQKHPRNRRNAIGVGELIQQTTLRVARIVVWPAEVLSVGFVRLMHTGAGGRQVPVYDSMEVPQELHP